MKIWKALVFALIICNNLNAQTRESKLYKEIIDRVEEKLENNYDTTFYSRDTFNEIVFNDATKKIVFSANLDLINTMMGFPPSTQGFFGEQTYIIDSGFYEQEGFNYGKSSRIFYSMQGNSYKSLRGVVYGIHSSLGARTYPQLQKQGLPQAPCCANTNFEYKDKTVKYKVKDTLINNKIYYSLAKYHYRNRYFDEDAEPNRIQFEQNKAMSKGWENFDEEKWEYLIIDKETYGILEKFSKTSIIHQSRTYSYQTYAGFAKVGNYYIELLNITKMPRFMSSNCGFNDSGLSTIIYKKSTILNDVKVYGTENLRLLDFKDSFQIACKKQVDLAATVNEKLSEMLLFFQKEENRHLLY